MLPKLGDGEGGWVGGEGGEVEGSHPANRAKSVQIARPFKIQLRRASEVSPPSGE